MAHVAKHTRVATGHLCAHYDRSAQNISNENIDTERTKENYNLALNREISQVEFIQERTREVQCMNRKDVNVMCSWLVTAPKDLPAEDNRQFFEESYKFLSARYGGEQNVVSAYVHMDEKQPHLHFAFVPVVMDKKKNEPKVSAKEAVTRKDLQTFHDDLDLHLANVFGRSLGVLNEATKDGNKSIAELKSGQALQDLKNARKELSQIRGDIKHLQATEKDLQARIQGLEGQVLTVKGLEVIQPEKTLTGAVKGVSVEQVQDLKKTAMQYHKIKGDYVELKKEYSRAQNMIPTMEERLKQGRTEQENRQLKRELKKANDFVAKIPEDVREQMSTELRQKQEKNRKHDLGMEL